jgi:hypothetical protein
MNFSINNSQCCCKNYDHQLDLITQNAVPSPAWYRDGDWVLEFSDLDGRTQSHFKSLLQYTSPQAHLNKVPSLVQTKGIKILNYTDSSLTTVFKTYFTELHINEKYIKIYENNCHIIAYQVAESAEILLEEKHFGPSDDPCPWYERMIVIQQNDTYKSFWPSTQLKEELKNPAIFARHPFHIKNITAFIPKDSCLIKLADKVVKEPPAMSKPKLFYYGKSGRNNNSCKILNFTDLNLTVDICNHLILNGTDTQKHLQCHNKIIAYSLQDNPKLIYFEHLVNKDIYSRFYAIPDPDNNSAWKLAENPPTG